MVELAAVGLVQFETAQIVSVVVALKGVDVPTKRTPLEGNPEITVPPEFISERRFAV